MITVLFRTIIIYIILAITMRILGKRQLGELEISELITTILLSEIATMPIANQDIPISYAIIPLITIVIFEVGISFLSSRFPIIKNLLSSPPSTLIYNGQINQRELKDNRISPEELLSELRINNITDASHVQYAILESNGMLSVIPKIQFQQPTLEHLNIKKNEQGIIHIIISQGSWNEYNLKLLNKSKSEFKKHLKKKKIKPTDIFLMTIDDNNNIDLVIKEKIR